MINKTIFGFYLFGVLAAQTEVMILSPKVGTEIDTHENRFYRIFPKEKGFINAQIIRLDKENFRVVIIKKIRGKEMMVKRFISLDDYEKLQLHVDAQPEFTEKAKIAVVGQVSCDCDVMAVAWGGARTTDHYNSLQAIGRCMFFIAGLERAPRYDSARRC